MAYLTYDLTPSWAPSSRFTAVGSVSMEVVNPMEGGDVHYAVTSTDDTPGLPVHRSGKVRADSEKAMILLDGERLWLASDAASGSLVGYDDLRGVVRGAGASFGALEGA